MTELDINRPSFLEVKHTGDFSLFLHELRSVALARLTTPKRLLSAGCSGLWYFEWIDKYLGKPELHIGLEFYSPKPDGLPSHVEWIQQNVYAMSGVESESVDMVFSGQNVEHLWAEELAGFLSEANRVLEDDGLLVVDSPNFPICQAYGWSHPEHITEFSVPQFTRLLEIYGFEVEQCIGLFGCKIDNELLPFDPGQVVGKDKITELRIKHGLSNPEDSFSWWIVAKKKAKPSSKKEELISSVRNVFSLNWPIRIQRQVLVPQLNQDTKNGLVEIKKGFTGVVMYGPYIPLKSGKYLVGYYLSALSHHDIATDEPIAIIDCAIGAEDYVMKMKTITYRQICASPLIPVTIEISLAQLTFGVQIRLISIGAASFRASRHIILEEIK